jgi:hypothetical protein
MGTVLLDDGVVVVGAAIVLGVVGKCLDEGGDLGGEIVVVQRALGAGEGRSIEDGLEAGVGDFESAVVEQESGTIAGAGDRESVGRSEGGLSVVGIVKGCGPGEDMHGLPLVVVAVKRIAPGLCEGGGAGQTEKEC